MPWLRAKVRALAGEVGAHEVHLYGGLLLVAAGGAMLNVAWTLVAVGSVLAALGFLSSRGV